MNNTFDFSRFKKVLLRDFYEYKRRFGTTLIIIMLLPSLVWLFWSTTNNSFDSNIGVPSEVRSMIIFWVVQLSVTLAPSWLYGYINMKKDGPDFATYPATYLEKFVSIIIYTIIVTPIVCYIGCYAIDTLLSVLPFGGYTEFLWQSNLQENLDAMYVYFDLEYTENSIETPSDVFTSILGLISTSALMFFTTTIFKKHKVLKTFGWMFLIYFVIVIIVIALLPSIIMNILNALESLDIAESGSFAEFWTTKIMNFITKWAVLFSIIEIVVCYVWGYFRMKRMKF